jgi:hypothetical protein
MNLIDLKKKYPDCYYHEDYDVIMIDDETSIADDARELIEEMYDGEKLDCFTSSGNPEDMVLETVTGRKYIEATFNGNYKQAFEEL